MCDRFENIDLKDTENIIRLAETLKSEGGALAGIMTAGTDFSAQVAFAAEKLGLPGIPVEAALDASDKERMRRRFTAAGVPSPAFCILCEPPGDDFAPPFHYPVVVKPVDNMGARGCRLVRSPKELRAAAEDALRYSRSSRAIVEEYLDGPEFSVDALVYRGEISICGLAERHIFYPPFFVEMGHTMPAEITPETARIVLDTFCAGVRALGIENGAAKGDIKYTTKGAFVGEIAARLSGGYMSGWTYPYSSGVEPIRGAVLIAAGMPPDIIPPLRSWTSAERAFISIPGTVRAIRGVSAAEKRWGIKDVFLRVHEGDNVLFPVNNVEKCGNVISAAPDRFEAVKAAEDASRSILIELESPDKETSAFLAAPLDTEFPPSAYTTNGVLAAALEKIPEDALYSGGELTVSPFPKFMNAALTDYAGRPPAESMDAVRTLTGLPLVECEGGVLGKEFWRAMLRGGYQGAAYHIKAGYKV
jgi:biotin carboxylase